jgi:hypothetical protein
MEYKLYIAWGSVGGGRGRGGRGGGGGGTDPQAIYNLDSILKIML